MYVGASPGDAIQRLEENHVGLVRLLGAPNGHVVDSPELVSTCIPGAPLFYNQVARARFGAASGAGRVASALAPFRAAEQRLVWSLPPSSAPENLNELLDAEGLCLTRRCHEGWRCGWLFCESPSRFTA